MASTFTNLLYDIIFSTKNRVPSIDMALRQELHAYLGGIVRELGGAALEIGGAADHVHLLVKLTPKIALSDFMRTLKTNSSKWMNEEKLTLRKFGWQDGYAAFTVSKSQAPWYAKGSDPFSLCSFLADAKIGSDPAHNASSP